MKYVMTLFGVLIFVIIVVLVAGYSFPAKTTATRMIELKKTSEEIFAVLADVQRMPAWNRNLEKIDILPPRGGVERTLQTFKGGMKMVIETTEATPPKRLVRSMADEHGPFRGAWTYEIAPAGTGTTVRLTEDAEVPNPVFRVVMRIFGKTKYMDEHLADLGKHFGETVTIR